jgi:hypothetical protein
VRPTDITEAGATAFEDTVGELQQPELVAGEADSESKVESHSGGDSDTAGRGVPPTNHLETRQGNCQSCHSEGERDLRHSSIQAR